MAQTHFGKFEKDGVTKTASSVAGAVALRFNGWKETTPATPAAAAELAPALQPKGDTKDTKDASKTSA